MRLSEIEPQHIKMYLHKLAEDDLVRDTIRRLLAPLRCMLADATEDGLIRFNPAAGVRIPSNAKQPDERRKNLTEDERAALRCQLARDEDLLLVDFLLAAALRVSEVMALDWIDFDARARLVSVRRRLYRGMGEPKSEQSKADVRLSAAMCARLEALRASRWYATGDHDPIFATVTGCRHNYSNLNNRVLTPAMRAAGIEYGAFHRLRHTTGTELRRKGVQPDAIQLHLRHHDPAFTSRTYIHLDSSDGPDPNLLDDVAGCVPAKRLRLLKAS
jgi:integrase